MRLSAFIAAFGIPFFSYALGPEAARSNELSSSSPEIRNLGVNTPNFPGRIPTQSECLGSIRNNVQDNFNAKVLFHANNLKCENFFREGKAQIPDSRQLRSEITEKYRGRIGTSILNAINNCKLQDPKSDYRMVLRATTIAARVEQEARHTLERIASIDQFLPGTSSVLHGVKCDSRFPAEPEAQKLCVRYQMQECQKSDNKEQNYDFVAKEVLSLHKQIVELGLSEIRCRGESSLRIGCPELKMQNDLKRNAIYQLYPFMKDSIYLQELNRNLSVATTESQKVDVVKNAIKVQLESTRATLLRSLTRNQCRNRCLLTGLEKVDCAVEAGGPKVEEIEENICSTEALNNYFQEGFDLPEVRKKEEISSLAKLLKADACYRDASVDREAKASAGATIALAALGFGGAGLITGGSRIAVAFGAMIDGGVSAYFATDSYQNAARSCGNGSNQISLGEVTDQALPEDPKQCPVAQAEFTSNVISYNRCLANIFGVVLSSASVGLTAARSASKVKDSGGPRAPGAPVVARASSTNVNLQQAQAQIFELRRAGKLDEANALETAVAEALEKQGALLKVPGVVYLKSTSIGTHDARLVTLPNGTKAVFRPGADGAREVAAYRFAREAGFDMPVTIEARIGGRQGSLQYYVENAETYEMIAKRLGYHSMTNFQPTAKTNVFDDLLGNIDRSPQNTINNAGNQVLIDCGQCFSTGMRAQLQMNEGGMGVLMIKEPALAARLANRANHERFVQSVGILTPLEVSYFRARLRAFADMFDEQLPVLRQQFRDAGMPSPL